MKLAWRGREPPLDPVAILARGALARRLATRLLDQDLGRFRAAAAPDFLLVRGEPLPWLDGVVHLGEAPEAPGWLLPCQEVPELPAALWTAALLRRGARAPAIFCPGLVLSGSLQPIDRDRLVAWSAA